MGRIEDAQAAFSEIYKKDLWGMNDDIEAAPDNVDRYVALIQDFLRRNDIRSVVEFGCSAWPHLRHVDWSGVEFDGYDILPELIAHITPLFGAPNIRFHAVTDGVRLPRADLLICKDVFQHLPCGDIQYYLGIFKKLYRYLLITDDVFPDTALNGDIAHGGYRAVRLDRPPFNEALAVVQQTEGTTFGVDWVKRTNLIFGSQDPDRPASYPIFTNESGRRRGFMDRLRTMVSGRGPTIDD